jgi:hypothetical protein
LPEGQQKMFTRKTPIDLLAYFRSFTHARIRCISSGDDYVALIDRVSIDEEKITLILSPMARCGQRIIDQFGTREWYSKRHLHKYPFHIIEIDFVREQLSKRSENASSDTNSTLYLNQLDYITLTSNPKEVSKIEKILYSTP